MSDSFVQTVARFALRSVIGLGLTALLLLGGYLAFTYNYSYSQGESVGFVQKLKNSPVEKRGTKNGFFSFLALTLG
jgi:hypothetical protein